MGFLLSHIDILSGAIGGLGMLASGVLGGWKKWALIGVVFVALGAWIGVEKVMNAGLRAEVSRLGAEVVKANSAVADAAGEVAEAKAVNLHLVAANEELRGDAEAAVAAVTRDRDRQIAAERQLRTIEEKIHVAAPACVGEPPAYTAALDFVRNTRP